MRCSAPAKGVIWRWRESRFHGRNLEQHRDRVRGRQLVLELLTSGSFSSIGAFSSRRIARERGVRAPCAHDLIRRRAEFEKQPLRRLLDRLAVESTLAPFLAPAQSVVVSRKLDVYFLELVDQLASPTRVAGIEWLVVSVEIHGAIDTKERLQVFQDRVEKSLPGVSLVAVRDDSCRVLRGGGARFS